VVAILNEFVLGYQVEEGALFGEGEVGQVSSRKSYDDEKRVWDFWRGSDARGVEVWWIRFVLSATRLFTLPPSRA
jgi:hypothetical protein